MSTSASVDAATEANEELARSAIWRFLAQALTDPLPGSAEELLVEDLSFAEAVSPSLPPIVAAALERVSHALASAGALALEDDHRSVFSHVHSADCPPFETDHTASQIWRQSQELADLAGFYRAFGVEQERERPDHVSVELEFLHLLAYKAAWALANGDREHAETCHRAYSAFLRDHVLRWVPAFADRLAIVARGRPLGSVSRLLVAVLESEAARLGLGVPTGPATVEDGGPRPDERGLCEGEP